jgi:hypothetical protein
MTCLFEIIQSIECHQLFWLNGTTNIIINISNMISLFWVSKYSQCHQVNGTAINCFFLMALVTYCKSVPLIASAISAIKNPK